MQIRYGHRFPHVRFPYLLCSYRTRKKTGGEAQLVSEFLHRPIAFFFISARMNFSTSDNLWRHIFFLHSQSPPFLCNGQDTRHDVTIPKYSRKSRRYADFPPHRSDHRQDASIISSGTQIFHSAAKIFLCDRHLSTCHTNQPPPTSTKPVEVSGSPSRNHLPQSPSLLRFSWRSPPFYYVCP